MRMKDEQKIHNVLNKLSVLCSKKMDECDEEYTKHHTWLIARVEESRRLLQKKKTVPKGYASLPAALNKKSQSSILNQENSNAKQKVKNNKNIKSTQDQLPRKRKSDEFDGIVVSKMCSSKNVNATVVHTCPEDFEERMSRLTVKVLRHELKSRGLPTQGRKKALVERLCAAKSAEENLKIDILFKKSNEEKEKMKSKKREAEEEEMEVEVEVEVEEKRPEKRRSIEVAEKEEREKNERKEKERVEREKKEIAFKEAKKKAAEAKAKAKAEQDKLEEAKEKERLERIEIEAKEAKKKEAKLRLERAEAERAQAEAKLKAEYEMKEKMRREREEKEKMIKKKEEEEFARNEEIAKAKAELEEKERERMRLEKEAREAKEREAALKAQREREVKEKEEREEREKQLVAERNARVKAEKAAKEKIERLKDDARRKAMQESKRKAEEMKAKAKLKQVQDAAKASSEFEARLERDKQLHTNSNTKLVSTKTHSNLVSGPSFVSQMKGKQQQQSTMNVVRSKPKVAAIEEAETTKMKRRKKRVKIVVPGMYNITCCQC